MSPDLYKIQALTDMPPLKMKKELQLFPGKLNYQSKFSTMTAKVCGTLHKLILVKAVLTWNKSYQDLYKIVKTIFKRDV